MPTVSQDEFDPVALATPEYFPHYAYRNPENIELFKDLGPVLSCSKGYVFRARGNAEYCYMVLSGQMAATINGLDDFTRQSAFFLEGSLFLEPSALSGLPSNIAYYAMEATRVVRMDRDDLQAEMARNPRVFDAVMKAATMKLNAAHEQLREAMMLDVRARIYFLLLGIASTCSTPLGEGWYQLTIKLTQQQMSDMLGVNRVTVNTALQYLYSRDIARKQSGFYCIYDSKGALAS